MRCFSITTRVFAHTRKNIIAMPHKYFLFLAIAFLTLALSSSNSHAQSSSTDTASKPTWPTTLTLGFGGAMNDTWNGGSQYSPIIQPSGTSPFYIWTKTATVFSPEFHILAEIPIASNLMLA